MAIQFAAAILPSKRKLIQIGISVYRNQCVNHFIRCVNSCLEQEGANFFIDIRADGYIPKEIKQYIENALTHHNNISFKQGKEHLGTFGSYREIFSKCGWSPFSGHHFANEVAATWINGHLRYKDGQILSGPCGKAMEYDR